MFATSRRGENLELCSPQADEGKDCRSRRCVAVPRALLSLLAAPRTLSRRHPTACGEGEATGSDRMWAAAGHEARRRMVACGHAAPLQTWCPRSPHHPPWKPLGSAYGTTARATSFQVRASSTRSALLPSGCMMVQTTTPSSSLRAPGRATNTGSQVAPPGSCHILRARRGGRNAGVTDAGEDSGNGSSAGAR